MSTGFVRCACCSRTALEGTGTCTGCKPNDKAGTLGCNPDGYGGWKRCSTCPIRAQAARRKKGLSPTPQGDYGSATRRVHCRWCEETFPLWLKDGRGEKISWQVLVRGHCLRRHKKELAAGHVWRPADMILNGERVAEQLKQRRCAQIADAMERLKRRRG